MTKITLWALNKKGNDSLKQLKIKNIFFTKLHAIKNCLTTDILSLILLNPVGFNCLHFYDVFIQYYFLVFNKIILNYTDIKKLLLLYQKNSFKRRC